MRATLCYLLGIVLLASCQPEGQEEAPRFTLMAPEQTGIDFINAIEPTEDFNIFSYRNFYNGGGVAIGDINNDGLPDIYFTCNMGPNKLYLNRGNFRFEDITELAGVAGNEFWSTGVVMVDINTDGLLDIYVCNAGYDPDNTPENELFLNQGDGTFREAAAEYGLDEDGYTTHAAFFDYDQDGDLDAYILNNSFMPVNTLNYSNKRELYAEEWPVKPFLRGGGDKLMRNDNGQFVDVSREAGIYGSLIGFGLGITVGDVNGDHLPDLYVSNDFFERDYLYINQGDGTFTEEIKDYMEHLSLASMGADMADINNDGYPEIFVTEMLPETDYRRKTAISFENYNTYYLKLQRDFYHQYMHNTLQYNNRDRSFSEIAYYSGVAATEWSWGALMFDANNDGLRDLYVCNGVYHDVTDQDFMDFFANEVAQKMALTGQREAMENIVARMPSEPQLNKAFRNRGDLTFEDAGVRWGFDQPTFSNGAAYGDLDNDGDLDLVINNLNMPSMVYRNETQPRDSTHYLMVELRGPAPNTYAVGAKIRLHQGDQLYQAEVIPSRGFQSSVDYRQFFGLGKKATLDSMVVVWPDRSATTWTSVPVDTVLQISYVAVDQQEASSFAYHQPQNGALLQGVDAPLIPHDEDDFIDFFQEGLTMRMVSREGPFVAVGDVDADGNDDLYIGGAAGQAGQLYLQTSKGLTLQPETAMARNADFEDTAVTFFDMEGDGDLDLFVGSGGNHMARRSRNAQDRIYRNDGTGNFELATAALPPNGYNTGWVIAYDYDQDGDEDLIVGSRSIPQEYGTNPTSYLYRNDGQGNFTDVTESQAPDFRRLGMLTDGLLVDLLGGDDQPELLVLGEWMSPKVFSISPAGLQLEKTTLDAYTGWWYTAATDDIDQDGDQDLILGNRGENFYFSGTPEAPAKLWVADFDKNGTIEKIITRQLEGRDFPIPLKRELTEQIPSLKKESLRHAEYAEKTIQDLFPANILEEALVKEGTYFQSAVALNDGAGRFTLEPLPKEVQFSCVCDIFCGDLNQDGRKDLVLGGNYSGFMPQFSKLDASFGHVLLNDGQGTYRRLNSWESGLFLRGEIRQIVEMERAGIPHLLITRNDEQPAMYRYTVVRNTDIQ